MSDFKILFIEHDEAYQEALISNLYDIDVELVIIDFPEEIDNALGDTRFDLVVTDVFWPDEQTKKDISRLDEIINRIRKKDSVVPIVVLSGEQESFDEAITFEGQIFDLWSKLGGYPDYHKYRVRNVIHGRQNRYGEEVLLKKVFELCENDDSLWSRTLIMEFIAEFMYLPSPGIMFKKIALLFQNLSYNCGIEFEYSKKIFNEFAMYEPLDLARKNDSWGHLRHSLSIYLAGFILLNDKSINTLDTDIFHDTNLRNLEQINQVWFITCAFHDFAILYQHTPEIVMNICKHSLENFENKVIFKRTTASGKVSSMNLNDCYNVEIRYDEHDYQVVSDIFEYMDKQEYTDKMFEYMSTTADHGILAATHLYRQLCNNDDLNISFVNNIIFAIMIHNCSENIGIKLIENKTFIAQLLIILDKFQAWGRENEFEGFLEDSVFEKIVLREFEVSQGYKNINPMLLIHVDYLPFRYLSPQEKYIKDKEIALRQIFMKHFDDLKLVVGINKINGKLLWKKLEIKITCSIIGRQINI